VGGRLGPDGSFEIPIRSDTHDSWFAGFTGTYLSVVWVGYDDNHATGLTGAQGAVPIWADIMGRLKSASYEPVPPELVEDRWIDFSDDKVIH